MNRKFITVNVICILLNISPKNKNEVKMYYLKVLSPNNKKQICEIIISPYVYNYLINDLADVPIEKKGCSKVLSLFRRDIGKDKVVIWNEIERFKINCRRKSIGFDVHICIKSWHESVR